MTTPLLGDDDDHNLLNDDEDGMLFENDAILLNEEEAEFERVDEKE